MNILVLHQMGNPKRWLKAVSDLELALPKSDSDNNYIVHDTLFNFPEFLKDFPFDGIILNSTFLDARHQRGRLDLIKDDYNFIKNSTAIKVALAQDDYYCNKELDNWMVDWKVDYFYTVVHEHSQELFPKYFKYKGEFQKGFTGYISSETLSTLNSKTSFLNRKVDVGYRATDVVTNLNQLVILKAKIGNRFLQEFSDTELNLDISTKIEDRIYGNKWFNFVEDCKFMIATNSGSSLVIPDLDFKYQVDQYLKQTPNWNYSKVKELFFNDQDESISYTAISPRNIEAALLETGQINTTLGNYSGILEPWDHFIPLENDCSNKEEVLEAIHNVTEVQNMILRAKEAVLSHEDLRLDHLIKDILTKIESGIKERSASNESKFKVLQLKYRSYIKPKQRIKWAKDKIVSQIKTFVNYKSMTNRVR